MNWIAKKMLAEHLDGHRDDRYRRERDYDGEREYRGRYERKHYDSRRDYERPHRMSRAEYRDVDDDYRDIDDDDYDEHHRDYHDDVPLKIHSRDAKEWERRLKNADGTSGVKYDKDTVRSIAEQEGVKFDKFSLDDLYLTTNMMYSDYCIVARKYGIDRTDFYVCMAKAFLEDKDFDGEPSEKLAMYYYCIVDGE